MTAAGLARNVRVLDLSHLAGTTNSRQYIEACIRCLDSRHVGRRFTTIELQHRFMRLLVCRGIEVVRMDRSLPFPDMMVGSSNGIRVEFVSPLSVPDRGGMRSRRKQS
jgi:hypothetical protein